MSLPAAFLTAVERLIPAERRFDDPLSTLAFGTDAPALLAAARKVNAAPVAIWLAGIAVYHLAPKVLPDAGSALPTLAFSFVLAWATRPKAR